MFIFLFCFCLNLESFHDGSEGSLDDVKKAQEGESQEETKCPSKLTDQGVKGIQQHFLAGRYVCRGVKQAYVRETFNLKLSWCSNNRVVAVVAGQLTCS